MNFLQIKNPNSIMTTERAEKLAADLNADNLDDWTYEVVKNPENESRAIVKASDENGDFVTYL